MPLEKKESGSDNFESYTFESDAEKKEVICIKFGKLEMWMGYDDPGITIIGEEPIIIEPESPRDITIYLKGQMG